MDGRGIRKRRSGNVQGFSFKESIERQEVTQRGRFGKEG